MVIRVVGAALVRDQRVLAARRAQPPRLAGGWEFPGGKVEADESDVDALVRELHEELGVRIQVGVELGNATEAAIRLTLYAAILLDAEPHPLQDHDELRWLSAGELDSVGWLPIDAELLPAVAQFLAQPG